MCAALRLVPQVIYLPGIPLPTNIIACPDIKTCVTGATMMVFVIPHNFLAPIVPKMEGAFAKGAIGISLIKGIEFEKDGEFKPILISDLLAAEMAKAEGAPKVPNSDPSHTLAVHGSGRPPCARAPPRSRPTAGARASCAAGLDVGAHGRQRRQRGGQG